MKQDDVWKIKKMFEEHNNSWLNLRRHSQHQFMKMSSEAVRLIIIEHLGFFWGRQAVYIQSSAQAFYVRIHLTDKPLLLHKLETLTKPTRTIFW